MCGGLIRDSLVRFIASFWINIRCTSITKVEIWGIYVGVKLTNSMCALQLIHDHPQWHVATSLIRSIRTLLAKQELFRVHHIFREANFPADTLVKHA
ncbi:hypothetical protein AHAS_Ahas17G0197000 [Arachis hypogaea]